MTFPWNDRNGRLSALKLVVFTALFVPAILVGTQLYLGDYGAEPIKITLRHIGLWALRLLFLSLAITPARQLLGWPRLIVVRRMVGVAAFAYALTHLVLYTVNEKFDLAKVASEIVLRFYLTIGFIAVLGLAALAVTSTDGMIRRMGGRAWRRLHYLVYPIALLGLVHFFIQTRLNLSEPMVMAGLFAWLMIFRLQARLGAASLPPVAWGAIVGIVCAAGTALGDATYYWLKTGVDPVRVLAATFGTQTGFRPGLVVFALTLAATALAGGGAALARAGRSKPRPR